MNEQDSVIVRTLRQSIAILNTNAKNVGIKGIDCVFIAQYGSDCKVATAGTASPTAIVNCLASFLASMHQAGELDYKKTLKLISADIERRLGTGKIRTFNEKDN